MERETLITAVLAAARQRSGWAKIGPFRHITDKNLAEAIEALDVYDGRPIDGRQILMEIHYGNYGG